MSQNRHLYDEDDGDDDDDDDGDDSMQAHEKAKIEPPPAASLALLVAEAAADVGLASSFSAVSHSICRAAKGPELDEEPPVLRWEGGEDAADEGDEETDLDLSLDTNSSKSPRMDLVAVDDEAELLVDSGLSAAAAAEEQLLNIGGERDNSNLLFLCRFRSISRSVFTGSDFVFLLVATSLNRLIEDCNNIFSAAAGMMAGIVDVGAAGEAGEAPPP